MAFGFFFYTWGFNFCLFSAWRKNTLISAELSVMHQALLPTFTPFIWCIWPARAWFFFFFPACLFKSNVKQIWTPSNTHDGFSLFISFFKKTLKIFTSCSFEKTWLPTSGAIRSVWGVELKHLFSGVDILQLFFDDCASVRGTSDADAFVQNLCKSEMPARFYLSDRRCRP